MSSGKRRGLTLSSEPSICLQSAGGGSQSPLVPRRLRTSYSRTVPTAKTPNPAELERVVSEPRFETYLLASSHQVRDALELYRWNAEVSAALMLPAHFAEVSARNAVSEVLTIVYGPDWPWVDAFRFSLPSPRQPHFNPRQELEKVRSRELTTGKVIAELKFRFWESTFTSRQDGRLWTPHLLAAFPGAPDGSDAARLRNQIREDLEAIRALRNRLAHHEPIFARPLRDDLRRMLDLIDLRSQQIGNWVRSMETATQLVTHPPRSTTRRSPVASRTRGLRSKLIQRPAQRHAHF